MNVTLPPPGAIGAEITNVDVVALGPDQGRAVRELVYEHKLVVFRDVELSSPEYIDLARRLGTPQIYFQPNYLHPDHPEIFVSSNVPHDGQKVGVAGTGRYWHTDYQFFPEPLPLTLVYPRVLPRTNRETYYIDMQAVYDHLPTRLRTLVDGARCVHEAKYRYKVQAVDIDKSLAELLAEVHAMCPPVEHPAVIVHPVHERRHLYVSRGFTTGIVGHSHEESADALAELFEFIEREEHVHVHPWREGDLLLWDNRAVIHMASTVAKGEQSESHRIGVYDGLPFYVNAA